MGIVSNAKFTETNAIVCVDFDPNQSDTLTNVNSTRWIDMANWNRLTCILIRTVGTGHIGDAGLYVSAARTGTSAQLVGSLVGSSSVTGVVSAAHGSESAPDCGTVVLECTHDQIATALPGGQFVSARACLLTGTDEFAAIYILSEPRAGFGARTATFSKGL